MNLINVNVKILSEKFKEKPELLPRKHSDGAGAIDLRAMKVFLRKEDGSPNFKESVDFEKYTLKPGQVEFFGTGLAIFIGNENFVGNVIPRSSSGSREYMLANTYGYIDSDYQGEIITGIRNTGEKDLIITSEERLTQYFITPIFTPILNYVEDFKEETIRGSGGFGSTGHK